MNKIPKKQNGAFSRELICYVYCDIKSDDFYFHFIRSLISREMYFHNPHSFPTERKVFKKNIHAIIFVQLENKRKSIYLGELHISINYTNISHWVENPLRRMKEHIHIYMHMYIYLYIYIYEYAISYIYI